MSSLTGRNVTWLTQKVDIRLWLDFQNRHFLL